MIINLLGLPGDGQQTSIYFEYPKPDADSNFEDQLFLEPLVLEAGVYVEAHYLFVDGSVKTRVTRICARCAKEITCDVEEPIHLVVEINDMAQVDITDDVYEALLIGHPMRFVCQDDCKGLCSVCGVNRNSTSCTCQDEASSHIFSALKDKLAREE